MNQSTPQRTPQAVLETIYGYDAFRGQQLEIINHVVAGGHAFVLMPTGGGKSLCYQIPALCRAGVAVVVSPLIALMQDQVRALEQLGIRAAALNSTLSSTESRALKQNLRDGALDLVYVSPERLLMADFMQLLHDIPLALFAIDEAHCVSQWGHDFRPEYMQLGMLAETFPHVPRLALTATADAPTRRDIIEKLHLGAGKTFIAGFDRPNITYTIVEKQNPRQQLLQFIRNNHPDASGIVYCLSRRKVDETTQWLRAQGFNALAYHAGMGNAEKAHNQNAFLKGENVIMVATIAFGMGIDKPDVRFVAHLDLPKNIEGYYQETGRAGRDGLPADAWMTYGMQDAALQRNFIETGNAPDVQKRVEHQKLNALLGLCEAPGCRRQVLLAYFGDSCAPCGNCDTCQNPPEGFDGTVAAQKALSCVLRTDQRFGVKYLIDVLLGGGDARLQSFGHDKISTFNIGHEHTRQQWQGIFRQLVAQGFLQVDVTGHGGLYVTEAGWQFLKEKQTITLRQPQAAKAPRKIAAPAALQNPGDKELFEALRAKRAELAKAQNVPPYVIFHDKTLVHMATLKPQNAEQLAQVSGVGDAKMARYGATFLDVVAQFSAA